MYLKLNINLFNKTTTMEYIDALDDALASFKISKINILKSIYIVGLAYLV